MAKKLTYTATPKASGRKNIVANTEIPIRVYRKQNGGLAFVPMENFDGHAPESTVAIYSVAAMKSKEGRLAYPESTLQDLKDMLVKDKLLTKSQAESLSYGMRGSFYLKSEDKS